MFCCTKYPYLFAIPFVASLWGGCESETPILTPEPEVAATAQQLRAGAGQAGEVFLALDVLATHGKHQAVLGCGESSLELELAYSREGEEGPFVDLPSAALQRSCGAAAGDFALVVDNSGSEDGFLPELTISARNVMDRVLADGGRASLVRVSTDARVLSELTDDRRGLGAALDGMFVNDGWTALYDGIRMANETLGRAAQAQAGTRYPDAASFCTASAKLGVVAITDGRENNSSHQKYASNDRYPGDGLDTELSDLKKLEVAGITTPIYTIGLGDQVAHDTLADLSEHTGGRHMRIDDRNDIFNAFDVIGDYAQARHQVCTELPAGVCGPLHVRVRHSVASHGRRGGAPGTSASGDRTYYMNVPCAEPPATARPGGVATMLLAMTAADIPWPTAMRLASQTAEWVSTVSAPRILVVSDDNHHNEHRGDVDFVALALAEAGFEVTVLGEPEHGLEAAQVDGYDVVWLSNPGYPVDDAATVDVLLAFARSGGGVVFQGDDMSWSHGHAFSMTPATGLVHMSNGTSYCGRRTDNGSGAYTVVMAEGEHPIVAGMEGLTFAYRDDIDTVRLSDAPPEVLAWATVSGVAGCADKPVIAVHRL